MQLENNLGRDNIKTLVVRLAIPSMLAQFVSVFYSIVDRMYIGNISGVGELALAGVGICGPIVTLISSFSALIGFGGTPLLAIRMGEKNTEAARKVLANSFMMLMVLAVFLCQRLYHHLSVRNRVCPDCRRLKPVYHLPGLC